MRSAGAGSSSRRALYTLLLGSVISMVGNQLTLLAIPWFVLETTGSAVQTGITAFFTILPVAIAGFFGGTLVDRLGYRRTSIIADIASGVTVALIPLLYGVGLLPFWLLLALVFLGALLDVPGQTARAALIPELADAAGLSLERASSLLQIAERSSRLIGAPLAGVLVAVIGAQNVLWVDAVSFAVSAVMVAVAIPDWITIERAGRQTYLSDLMEGLRFLRADRLLLVIIGTVMITNFLDAAKGSVIYPVFAREVYDSATVLGLMFGLSGGGAVIGALLYGWIGERYSRRWIFLICFIAVSLPSFVLALFPPLWVVLLTQLLMGAAAGPINPVLSTVEYERIPVHMRGRVFGTITAGAWIAMPLGALLAGYALEGVGLAATLVGVGILYLLTTGSLLFMPVLREMDQKPMARG